MQYQSLHIKIFVNQIIDLYIIKMPFKANSKTELTTAIAGWVGGSITSSTTVPSAANSTINASNDTYAEMNLWDVTAVTDMTDLFSGKTGFNEDISGWDVSKVENMSYMFRGASAFNQDIGGWDVSAVTTMSFMFGEATLFNQDIGQWNVSAVTNMSYMFLQASAFNDGDGNAPLEWNVKELVNASGMFREANSFNQKLNWINTELKLENVSNMFYINTKFNQNVNVLFQNGNKINDMQGMFERASEWNNGGTKNVKTYDISNGNIANNIEWYTDNVTNMESLFSSSGLNQEIQPGDDGAFFNTWKVTNMSYMFFGLSEFNEPLGFMNTAAVTNMSYMFNTNRGTASKFNDGNTLGMGGWDTSNVTTMTHMFRNAESFRGKVNTWDVTSVTSGGFDEMFTRSGLVNDDDTPKDDIFKQDFRKTPTAEKFGYKFLEKEAGLITWDSTTGRATGAYNLGVGDSTLRYQIGSAGIGANNPYVTSSGNALFNLDEPYDKAFKLRNQTISNAFPSYWAAAVAFTLSVKTGETAVGMNVYDPTNNTKEGNKKLIENLVGFIDIDDPNYQLSFGRKRIMYYEEGIFTPTTGDPLISYITLEKDGNGNYTQWTTKTVNSASVNSASELLALGPAESPSPSDYIYDDYIAIDENSAYIPTTPLSNVTPLALCTVTHAYTTDQATALLSTPFGAWFIATYQPTAEYRSVLSTTISAEYPTGNMTDPVVVEYIQHLIDRHVVTIDGTKVLIDNNKELYGLATGQKLGTTYSGTYYNSNLVSDLKKPLDRLRLIAHSDFSPHVSAIYDALVPFCEASTDGKSSKNYKKLYPSDLQQLYSSYYSDAGVVNKSFACGSPKFPGQSTQAAEDDADYYFDVLRGVFSGNYDTVKGQYTNRSLVGGFQDLRLIYFERGFYNPILDVNGNEVQPGDASYGTVYKPYVSYIHFIDGQTLIKRKQTVDSTDGIYGLYAFMKQLPLSSFIQEFTITTDSFGFKKQTFDQTDTNTKIKTMVDAWYQKANDGSANAVQDANKIYGSPKYWITERITNMDGLFGGKTGPNHPDIDYWNMYNVTSSKNMFKGSSFNGELANWERYFPEVDASGKRSTMQNHKDMSSMFSGTTEFNQDIGGWDVDGALDMQSMFYDAAKFDQSNLCKWAPANENVDINDMFGYNTTETPMYKNGPSYGFNVPDPLYSQFGNCAPKFTTTPVTTGKVGDKYTYTATATDLDTGNTVIMTATQSNGEPLPNWLSFAVAPANGASYVLSGTPTSSDVGNNSVELRATDGTRSSTQSFTIVVAAADNNAPVFTSTPVLTGKEGVAYSYTVTASDSDGDSVSIAAATKPSWLSLNTTTNVLSGTPASSNIGNNSVELRATDSRGATATQSFTIVVAAKDNNAPTFTSTPVITGKDGVAYSYTVTTNDADGDSVTVTATTKPSWLSLNTTTNVLSGTPASSNIGNNSVELRATDSRGATATQSFTIVVSANAPPVFTSNPVTSVAEDTLYSYKVTATDSDSDAVTIVANAIPSWATYSGGVLSGRPANKYVGTYPVKFTATDGKGGSAVQEFNITVQNVNDAPVFTSTPPRTARQESLYSYKVTTSDPDVGDTVTVTATKIPGWLSFNTTTNVLSGTPSRSVWGEYNVILTASDGALETHDAFTIMVRKPVCFNEGTKILCFKDGKEQYVRVGRLREGDQVKTLNHGYKKITDMRKGTYILNGLRDMGMYRMKKQGNMIADLEMSGLHSLLVDANDAKYADDIKRQRGINNKNSYIDGKFRLRANESHEFQQMEQKEYTIYSFALEDKQEQYGIWANGVLVETTKRKNLEISNMKRIGQSIKGDEK